VFPADIVALAAAMSSDASTLPLRETPLGGTEAARRRGLLGRRPHALVRANSTDVRVGALSLLVIVMGCALIVALAADRPSILAPQSNTNFYPHWMAGPLGGLWPGLPRDTTMLRYLFTGLIVAMYAAYATALRHAPRLPARWVIGAVLAVHAIFVLSPPLTLTDVFNYINYGRMEVVHNLNPYTSIAILEPHGDPSFTLSNWHQLLSPYGPLFTLLTFAVVPLGVAGSFWALKGILAVASLATIFLVWKCARLLGRDPVVAIVLVGLNPIVLVWGLGGDHNDFLMVFFIVLGFYLLLRARAMGAAQGAAGDAIEARGASAPASPPGRVRRLLLPVSPAEIGAGAAFLTATAIKASAGILIPVVLAGLARAPRRLTQVLLGLVAAGLLVGGVSLLAFGLHLPDLSTQSRVVNNESVPNLLGLLIGAGGESEGVRFVMTGALAGVAALCCVLAWRRRDSVDAAAWASVAPLLTLGWVLPWYVLWALPLAALSGSRRLRHVVLAVGIYLIVAFAPVSSMLWSEIGFHPEKTPLGRLHQRYVRQLLN
jgi:hypothetical protein